MDGLVAVVLAAGAGTRLRPLTLLRPKPLCPVGDRPLVEHAIGRAAEVSASVAVNTHHGWRQLAEHLAGRDVHLSIEQPTALETAGALGRLRSWIDGRDVLVVNADAYHRQPLTGFVAGWDRQRVRLLTVHDPPRGDFGAFRYVGCALLPWRVVGALPDRRLGLYPAVFAPAWQAVRRGDAVGHGGPVPALDLVTSDRPFHDCGTPAGYLAANLAWSGGRSVLGRGADVAGEVIRSVVWPGARVGASERLVAAIRATEGVTVHVRGG